MITGISGFGFFWSKMAVSWRITFFQRKIGWNPYFYSVLGVRVFWAKLSKKAILDTPPKKKKIDWQLRSSFFGVFVFFTFSFIFFCFFCCFLFFFGGFKGQVRWPEGPPQLALNPPYLLFVFVVFLFLFFLFFPFLSLLSNTKKTCFSEKGIFVYFWVSAFVSP